MSSLPLAPDVARDPLVFSIVEQIAVLESFDVNHLTQVHLFESFNLLSGRLSTVVGALNHFSCLEVLMIFLKERSMARNI